MPNAQSPQFPPHVPSAWQSLHWSHTTLGVGTQASEPGSRGAALRAVRRVTAKSVCLRRRCPKAELASRSPLTYASAAVLDRIKVTPGVCEGRPTIRGLRLTVDFVLKLLGDAYTADDIVREYPELEKEDVYQAAKYGAWLASERTSAVA